MPDALGQVLDIAPPGFTPQRAASPRRRRGGAAGTATQPVADVVEISAGSIIWASSRQGGSLVCGVESRANRPATVAAREPDPGSASLSTLH